MMAHHANGDVIGGSISRLSRRSSKPHGGIPTSLWARKAGWRATIVEIMILMGQLSSVYLDGIRNMHGHDDSERKASGAS